MIWQLTWLLFASRVKFMQASDGEEEFAQDCTDEDVSTSKVHVILRRCSNPQNSVSWNRCSQGQEA